jgi:acyl carrier protein
MVTAVPETSTDIATIEVLVLELLGAELDEEPDALRRRLLDGGAGMPIDSLELVDILVDLRKRTGLTIPKRKLRRQTMRSVREFVEFIAREARP